MDKLNWVLKNEMNYLGSILKDPELIEEAELSPEHFIDLNNRELYRAMLSLHKSGEKVSVISLARLGQSTVMAFGGTQHLSDLANNVLSVHTFKYFEQNILHYYVVQEAKNHVNNFLERTTETHDVKELTELIQVVSELESKTLSKTETFKQLIVERMEEHYSSPESGLSGTSTGFKSINDLTDGWQPSDLIVIGARPSMGKTALVLNSILKATKESGVMAILFTLEMAKKQIIDRLIACEGRINLMKMRNPNKSFSKDDWDSYAKAIMVIEKLNLDIRDENTVPAIRAAIRKNMKDHPDKKHVIAIDFLTLIKPTRPTGNMHNDITEIILELKETARTLNVPIIVLSQLSRGIEQRQDKRPTMSDLRESGTIEQAADIIGFLYRDDYYNDDTENKGITEILIRKNRNGATGDIFMKFVKETNTFFDLDYRK